MNPSLKYYLVIIAIPVTIWFCERNMDSDNVPSGIYTGTFSCISDDGDRMITVPVRIEFLPSGYTISGRNTRYYGYGEWDIREGKIIFHDALARNAVFSREWILNGEYDLSADGSELLITGVAGNDRVYEYRLEKKK